MPGPNDASTRETTRLRLRLPPAAYDFALQHIEKYGDTDLLPVPFEYTAIRAQWNTDIRPWLLKQDVTSWVARPARRILVPKRSGGQRMAMQLDPLDSIFYTALVYAMAPDIERNRVPVSKRVAISHRFSKNSNGDLWSRSSTWEDFGNRSRQLARRPGMHFVLSTDIADFYSRIYHHRLDAALFRAVNNAPYVRALMTLLGAWSGNVSYGIPIGNSASRLLAEVVLNEIDVELINQHFVHCRWIDDFRIFCKTGRDAAHAETFLARSLFEIHGLTLQSSKSMIQTTNAFLESLSQSDQVMLRVSIRSDDLTSVLDPAEDDVAVELGDIDPASLAEADFRSLPESTQETLDKHDLSTVLTLLIAGDRLDLGLGRILIRELRERMDASAIKICVDNIERLSPIISDIVDYLISVRDQIRPATRRNIGKRALQLLQSSAIGESESGSLWLLWLFAESTAFDNEVKLAPLYEGLTRDEERRKIMLAMANASMSSWFMRMRNSAMAMPPWNRRAFIYGARCMSGDERKHWYKSVHEQLDVLERVIQKFADKEGPKKRH